MRTVVSNSEVPHLWAHQTQDRARNSGESFWFDGPTLYSYRTPIAFLTTTADGQPVAVFTSRTYSVTTSGHQRAARSAVNHIRCVSVPVEIPPYNRSPAEIRDAYPRHLEWLAEEVGTAKNRISRAKRFDAYRSAVIHANEFCGIFGLDPFLVPETTEQVRETLAELDRQRAERRRIAAEKAEKEAKQRQRKQRQLLKRWLQGESVGYLGSLPFAYMRLRGDSEIETTLGAIVPVDHVRRFAPRILAVVRSGREFVASPDSPIRFGHYRLDRIDANGTVQVGCHKFNRKEIERAASLIGVNEPACLETASN